MNTMNTWLTGTLPAFGMSAPACVQGTAVGTAVGADFGPATAAARVRHIDALVITGANPGTSAWSPPDW